MYIRECDVYTFLLSNRNEYWNKKDFMEEEEKNFLLQSGNGSLSRSYSRDDRVLDMRRRRRQYQKERRKTENTLFASSNG